MAAMSIFFIVIIASKARFASPPPAASASVSARGVISHNQFTKIARFVQYLDELLKPETQEITWTS
jgi:hypothetical protein